jgi:glycosyltransferase involved in cell wall biosynthesis
VEKAECGLCVEPENPDALAEAILTLYHDPGRRERTAEGERGRVGDKEMGRIRTHRELEVYQMAFEAAMEIFEVTKGFPREETYSLTDQIRRSFLILS